jgi:hypothetical protein
MALNVLNKVLFELEDETYTSAAIDVRQYKAFALLVTYTEGGDETAHLEAAMSADGDYVLVADSSQALGTGSGGVGWDVTSQFPFYRVVVGDGSDATEGASGYLNVKQGD